MKIARTQNSHSARLINLQSQESMHVAARESLKSGRVALVNLKKIRTPRVSPTKESFDVAAISICTRPKYGCFFCSKLSRIFATILSLKTLYSNEHSLCIQQFLWESIRPTDIYTSTGSRYNKIISYKKKYYAFCHCISNSFLLLLQDCVRMFWSCSSIGFA